MCRGQGESRQWVFHEENQHKQVCGGGKHRSVWNMTCVWLEVGEFRGMVGTEDEQVGWSRQVMTGRHQQRGWWKTLTASEQVEVRIREVLMKVNLKVAWGCSRGRKRGRYWGLGDGLGRWASATGRKSRAWLEVTTLRLRNWLGDFPGGPVVKTSPSNTADVGLIPGQGAEIQHVLWSKDQNRK